MNKKKIMFVLVLVIFILALVGSCAFFSASLLRDNIGAGRLIVRVKDGSVMDCFLIGYGESQNLMLGICRHTKPSIDVEL